MKGTLTYLHTLSQFSITHLYTLDNIGVHPVTQLHILVVQGLGRTKCKLLNSDHLTIDHSAENINAMDGITCVLFNPAYGADFVKQLVSRVIEHVRHFRRQ